MAPFNTVSVIGFKSCRICAGEIFAGELSDQLAEPCVR